MRSLVLVSGSSIAEERAGDLSVDKQPTAGAGSTAYSSGVQMMASIEDSVVEGFTYYERWKERIGVPDERGYAELRSTGCLVLRSEASAASWRMLCYDAVGLSTRSAERGARLAFDMAAPCATRKSTTTPL